MIPINNRCLKQQEDSRPRMLKEQQMRLTQISMPDYCPHLHNPIDNMIEKYMKNQFEIHEPYNLVVGQPDQYCDSFKNWFYNGGCYQDFYSCKIKREQYDQQRFWSPHIKDEQSPSVNYDQGFQASQMAKQQEFQCIPRCSFQDPTKFLGSCLTASRQQKNNQRKLKVQAYLKKKSIRSFQKKIIYKCRKQVADNRIRYRGRFISVHQAAQILKLDAKGNYNSVQLMEKLKALNHLEMQKQQKQAKEQREQNLRQNNQVFKQFIKKNQQEI